MRRTDSAEHASEIETLSEALDRLAARGFVEDFFVRDGLLTCAGCTDSFDPSEAEIVEIVRFEGVTDPDDEAVVFAITFGASGPLGTYTVPFGASMPPDDAAVVYKLHHR